MLHTSPKMVPASGVFDLVDQMDKICQPAPMSVSRDCNGKVGSPITHASLQHGVGSPITHGVGSPITHGEMHALLEPLQRSLARVEETLQLLKNTSSPKQDSSVRGRMMPDVGVREELSCTPQPARDIADNGEGISTYPLQDETPVLTETQYKSNPELQEVVVGVSEEAPPSPTPKLTRGASRVTEVVNNMQDDEGEKEDLAERLEVDQILRMEGLGEEVGYLDRVAIRMEKSARWWAGLSEPERNSCIYRTVQSSAFENSCICVILFNSVLVAVIADWEVKNIGSREPVVLSVLQIACSAWFLLELIIRIAAHRLYFFFNNEMHWNIFDFILVIISIIDFVLTHLVKVQDGNNVGFMRVLRLVKLAKIFRSLRSFRFFKSLELLLVSFQRSFMSLFWGLVMLAFVLYLFTLIFVQAAVDYLTNEPKEPKVAEFYFGSFGTTFLSLYMGVTGGEDWGNLYRIMSGAGWAYGLGLVFFTFFFLFAIFNILTGTLVEKAMATSKPDRTDLIMHQRKKNAEEKEQFLKLCRALDHDGDGKISFEEFKAWMNNDVMLCYMQSIGIEIHDVELFFGTVACREGRNGTAGSLNQGEVTIEHFVEGCMNMRGSATALDMQRQLFEMHVLHHDLVHIDNSLTERLQKLEQLMKRSFGIASSNSNSQKRLAIQTSDAY